MFNWCDNYCLSLSRKFNNFVDETFHSFNEDLLDAPQLLKMNDDKHVLVQFKPQSLDYSLEFFVSENGNDFEFRPSKLIQDVKLTWFDEETPKPMLFSTLSKLSQNRRMSHPPEYFPKRINKIYFTYINKEIVPYSYSLYKI